MSKFAGLAWKYECVVQYLNDNIKSDPGNGKIQRD
jgi:hypothetical protein